MTRHRPIPSFTHGHRDRVWAVENISVTVSIVRETLGKNGRKKEGGVTTQTQIS